MGRQPDFNNAPLLDCFANARNDGAEGTHHHEVDLLIIGGGIIGSLLCLALKDTPFKLLLCDKTDFLHTLQHDDRAIALNKASIEILTQLGLWSSLAPHATPIQQIQVFSQHQYGATALKPAKGTSLGAVVAMRHFYTALSSVVLKNTTTIKATFTDINLKTHGVTLTEGEKTIHIHPTMMVAADGAQSRLRQCLKLHADITDYQQDAITCHLTLKRHHGNTAIEYFTPDGPLALLPLEGHQVALVWCVSHARAKTLLHLSDADFLQALQSTIGYRLGRLLAVQPRRRYPLIQTFMPQPVHGPAVFIGNAAQTLHPIAGQGLNLGLRDIAALAACLIKQGLHQDALLAYEQCRQKDRTLIAKATHHLVQLFTTDWLPLRLSRSLGLMWFHQIPLLESTLVQYASGYGSSPPDLACGIPLPRMHHEA